MIYMALGVPGKARGDRQSHTTLNKTKHPSKQTIKPAVYTDKRQYLANFNFLLDVLKSSEERVPT